MTFWQMLFLGLLQGLTEFLPVSSSGHLLLFEKLFGIESNVLLFNLMLHLSSLMAVVIYFRKDLKPLVVKPLNKTNKLIVVTSAISLAFAFIIRKFFEDALMGKYLSVGFLITAGLLMYTEFKTKKQENTLTEFGYGHAAMIGVFQGLAVLPGLSRSGFTISSGLLAKGEREMTAKYSFFASIPIILAASIYECITAGGFGSVNAFYLIVSMVICFTASMFAIKYMMKLVSKCTYFPFVIYLMAVGIASLFII